MKARQNRFVRIITVPYRALCKARDFYVNSMINCANKNFVGMQGPSNAPALPRSFSTSSARSDDGEDYRELVRAVSARTSLDSVGGAYDSMIARDRVRTRAAGGGGPLEAMPPRSISVAMGRIDEERPVCYFGEDVIIGKNVVNIKNKELLYPRSKSHAVARTAF